jgi:phosphoglycerol transferase MdoB-like AlkP superfamily enzyme
MGLTSGHPFPAPAPGTSDVRVGVDPVPIAAGDASGRSRIGPLRTPLVFLGCVLALASLSRLALTVVFWERVGHVPGSWWLLPIGVRLDLMTLCPLLMPVALVVLLWPERARGALAVLVAAYLAATSALMAMLEIATPGFLAEYDSRPNRIFVDYLAYPREVLPTVWGERPLTLVLGVLALVGTAAFVWRAVRRGVRADGAWPWWLRLMALPVVGLLLFAGARSTLSPRGGNISTAAFSGDHLTNELALNSTYAVAYALYERRHENDAGTLYGRLPPAEAIERVRRGSLVPPEAFTDPRLPTLHRQPPSVTRPRPLNLVILLEESLGAGFVGSLGGLPLTPNLDRLSREGVAFTNLFATGTRTVRGIEATVSGFLPTPSTSVVKLGLAQGGFFTLADLLRRHGYTTEFFYGGASNFDNMRGFFLNNGFARVIDEDEFAQPVFHGVWGVSDEDLVTKAHESFVAHGDLPFFALLLSTSNHQPFEYPAGRIAEVAGEPPLHGAIRYADYAIGELFRLAKQADYFERTVFLVLADHDTRVYGADLVPIAKFHIPAFVIAPGLTPARVDMLASQIDLAPTVLGLLGLETEHPMPGRDLMRVPPETPGHAIMQYDLTHAYRVGDHVVVHQPYLPARQFAVSDDELRREAVDPELARDALAHVQVAADLYRERRYRLP